MFDKVIKAWENIIFNQCDKNKTIIIIIWAYSGVYYGIMLDKSFRERLINKSSFLEKRFNYILFTIKCTILTENY